MQVLHHSCFTDLGPMVKIWCLCGPYDAFCNYLKNNSNMEKPKQLHLGSSSFSSWTPNTASRDTVVQWATMPVPYNVGAGAQRASG